MKDGHNVPLLKTSNICWTFTSLLLPAYLKFEKVRHHATLCIYSIYTNIYTPNKKLRPNTSQLR